MDGKDKIEALYEAAMRGEKVAFMELVSCFSPYIRYTASSFSLPYSEWDDVNDEGVIALYRAVMTYDAAHGASFTTYARVCIRNAIRSFVRSFRKQQEKQRNDLSLDDQKAEVLADAADCPEDRLLASEWMADIRSGMKECLSETERKVLNFRLDGLGTSEIAVMIGKDTKSVENTLFRARKKLRGYLA